MFYQLITGASPLYFPGIIIQYGTSLYNMAHHYTIWYIILFIGTQDGTPTPPPPPPPPIMLFMVKTDCILTAGASLNHSNHFPESLFRAEKDKVWKSDTNGSFRTHNSLAGQVRRQDAIALCFLKLTQLFDGVCSCSLNGFMLSILMFEYCTFKLSILGPCLLSI